MRSWWAYRANRVAQVIGYALMVLFLGTQLLPQELRSVVGGWINAHVAVSLIVLLLIMLLLWVPTLNLVNWKCPRCGELFSYPDRTRRMCQDCGLTKFKDPRAGEG